MPTTFEESRLRFTFGDQWSPILKYDGCSFFVRQVGSALPTTRAADFIGLCGGTLYLIEVKNFRLFLKENRGRIDHGELFDEVACKARDTVAALVGAHLSESEPELWRPLASALLERPTQGAPSLRVVLWLEGAADQGQPSRGGARRAPVRRLTYADALRKRLRWLDRRAIVCSMASPDLIPDLNVQSLPDA